MTHVIDFAVVTNGYALFNAWRNGHFKYYMTLYMRNGLIKNVEKQMGIVYLHPSNRMNFNTIHAIIQLRLYFINIEK